jgi:predicted nucleotidyltransferase
MIKLLYLHKKTEMIQLTKESIIFETVSGSRLYGLNTSTSDTDIRGVFIAPKNDFYGLALQSQVNDDKNDIVYYELNRFGELLSKQNPNILEFLSPVDSCVRIKHVSFDKVLEHKNKFITRQIRNTFGGYAIAQIGKARGLNKKIYQPMDKEKKTPMDFCYVPKGAGTISVAEWIDNHFLIPQKCGLSALNHIKDGYAMFYDITNTDPNESFFRGICFDDSNDVHLSSIPKEGVSYECTVYYNKDGYSKYCKDYKEYWEWVEKRNPARYEKNMKVGKGYDTKNMMHCVRLLRMAEEMLRTGELHVYRKHDREELLEIRNGHRDYDELVAYAEGKLKLLDELVPNSPLPEKVDETLLNKVLIEIRDEHYAANRV